MTPSGLAVAHTVVHVGRRSLGLGAVAIHLSACQALAGCRSEIWCVDTEEEVRWAAEAHGLAHGHIRRFPSLGPEFLAYAPAMERAMRNAAGREVSIILASGERVEDQVPPADSSCATWLPGRLCAAPIATQETAGLAAVRGPERSHGGMPARHLRGGVEQFPRFWAAESRGPNP